MALFIFLKLFTAGLLEVSHCAKLGIEQWTKTFINSIYKSVTLMLDLERAVWAENWTQTGPELDPWSPSCLPPPMGGGGFRRWIWHSRQTHLEKSGNHRMMRRLRQWNKLEVSWIHFRWLDEGKWVKVILTCISHLSSSPPPVKFYCETFSV